VKFYYVYKALAHPEHNGYVTPFTLKERLLHVKEARRTLGSQIPWICDTMQNDAKHALGNAPNSEFVIGPDLKVLAKRLWSDPAQLRKDLEQFVGKVDKPTRVSDLKLKTLPPPKAAATGVVKRLDLPGRLQALKIVPQVKDGGQPFYAKLRAEAEPSLLREGKGKLYLGFHLDPIYKVHWNNLTRPIKVTLQPPPGMTLSKTTLEGPKVKVESDVDPREFLVDVEAAEKGPLKLSVLYYACNDAGGWCKLLRQEYTVHLEADPDAGWARGRRPGGRGKRAGKKRGPFAAGANMGRIVAVDATGRTVTIITRDRKQTTYRIAKDARLMVAPRRPAELKDYQRGDMVRFRVEKSAKGPDVITGLMARRGKRAKRDP